MTESLLIGKGEMRTKIASHDWQNSIPGGIDHWPSNLKTALSICLNSNFPVAVYWGCELVTFYNDAFIALLGDKHPAALAQPAREVWAESLTLSAHLDKVQLGEPCSCEVSRFEKQNGKERKVFYDFHFTPLTENDNVEGVMHTAFRLRSDEVSSFRDNNPTTRNEKENGRDIFTNAAFLESQLKNFFQQAPAGIGVVTGPRHVWQIANTRMLKLIGRDSEEDVIGKPMFESVPEAKGQGFEEIMDRVYQTGERFILKEAPIKIKRAGKVEKIYIKVFYEPLREPDGTVSGIMLLSDHITEHVLTRKKLEEKEKEYREMANAMPQLVWVTDARGVVHFYNNQIEKFAGAKKMENGTWQWEGLLHPEDVIKTTEAWNKSVTTGCDYDIEHRIKMKDGSYCWHLSRAYSQKDRKGKILKWFGTATDIDKIKKTEELSRYVATLTQNIADAVITTDETYKITSWNKGAELLYGYKAEEVAGKNASEVLRTEFRSSKEREVALNELVKTGAWRKEVVQKTNDDRPLHILSSVAYIKDKKGKPIGSVAVNRDISEQKKIQEKIIESEERFRHISDDAPAFIFIAGENAEVEYLNKTWLDFTGMSFENAQGQSWAKATHPDDLKLIYDTYTEAFNERKSYTFEIRQKGPDDIYKWIFWKGTPRFLPNGKFEGMMGIGVDITARKEAEAELNYQKQLLQTVTENTSLALLLMNDQQHCIYMNDAAEEMTGFTLEELQGKPFHYFVRHSHTDGTPFTMEERPINQAPLYKRTKGEEIFVHKDGSFYPIAFTASPIVVDGKEIGTVIEVRNTTEEKKKEKALKEAKDQLELTFQNVPSDIFLFNSAGKIILANDSAAKFMGYENAKELLSEKDVDKIRKHGQEYFTACDENDNLHVPETSPLNHAFKTRKSGQAVYCVKFKNSKKVVWRQNTATPLLDENGNINMVLVSIVDITTQKETEKIIRDNEKKFRTLAETLPQLVWMTDETGEQEYASSRWKEYTGLEPHGIKIWNEIVHKDDLPFVLKIWNESLKNGKSYKAEARIKSKEGIYRWHYLLGEPIRNEEGAIIKWIGAFTDIHDQKTISKQLEIKVAERTAELKSLNKELERSNTDLQQFAHVISHDMKEPLRKIKIYGGMLKDQESLVDENFKKYLDKIDHSSTRLIDMVEGILKYSSINSETNNFQLIDLNLTLKEIKEDLELAIQQRKGTVKCSDLPTIEGSAVLIYQLFYNLISNSLKFTKQGVNPIVRITAKVCRGLNLKNSAQINQHAWYAEFKVEDNGIGFNEAHAQTIFQSFTRLNSKDKFEGTGLGLSLCKKIVDRHKGFIDATSIEGEGSIFRIILPMRQSVLQ